MTENNSTPPADDVREALAQTIWEWTNNPQDRKSLGDYDVPSLTDAILAAFEVRPRGTVTEAEVEAAWQSLLETTHDVTTREDIHTALEAARNA